MVLGATLLAGCASNQRDRTSAALRAIADSVGPFVLEENSAVLTVAPFASDDSTRGLIIADAREAQVRLYDWSGKLQTTLGRRGRGPGEFRSPVWAATIPGGGLAVTDLAGGVSLFDSRLRFVAVTAQVPFPVFKALPISSDRLLLFGRPLQLGRAPLVHIWGVPENRILTHFFATPGDSSALMAASYMGQVSGVARGDTVVAVFSLVDTLFLFSSSGVPIGSVPIPFERFRRVAGSIPSRGGQVARRNWIGQVSRISDVFWLRDGRYLVQYAERQGNEERWHLLGMDRNGRRLFETDGVGRLLVVHDDILVLQRDDRGEPNHLEQWRWRSE